MGQEKVFRCPFEVQGNREGKILDVVLSESREERLEALRTAFERFHLSGALLAIRCIPPSSALEGCTSNADLRPKILPYQAEIIAADLDDQLWPFLPHHDAARKAFTEAGLLLSRYNERAGRVFREYLRGRESKTLVDFAQLIERVLRANPHTVMKFSERTGMFRKKDIISFDESTLKIRGSEYNSKFSIVKTPFYPEAFGRYSPRVEIALTRHMDVDRLLPESRVAIRRWANEVYAAHGIPIKNLDETQQPGGLWLLEKLYTIEKL